MPRVRMSLLLALAAIAAGCGGDSAPAPATTTQAPPPAATTPAASAPPAETTVERPPPESVPPIPDRDASAPKPDPELFFLFAEADDARAAAADLERHGYRVRTVPPADDVKDWSVIAEGTPDGPDLKAAAGRFRPWAAARDGKYDGHVVPLAP